MKISNTLSLPCGAILKNRLAKSAMSENMASKRHVPDAKFETLYSRWAQGGCGLLMTGNIMIDSRHLGEPNNVVLERGVAARDAFLAWANAGTQHGTHLWVQLNHPGKQSPKFLNDSPVAPSAVPFESQLANMFHCPRELTQEEILDIIERFAFAAKTAQEMGFSGVQIHGAHGYLVNQFLSPLHNVRSDEWGGSLQNRMRFVVEIYKAIRAAVGPKFPVSIKLNSADFQKGGFSAEDSILVAQKLSELGMDLIEISGGTYESPEMMGMERRSKKESTVKREAYFLKYCEEVRKVVKTPLMLTGGFRSLAGMEQALDSGACDVIGLARSVALSPDFPNELLAGSNVVSKVTPLSTGFRKLDKIFPLEIIWYTHQLHRMGKGKAPNPNASAIGVALSSAFEIGLTSFSRVRASR